MNEKKHMQAQRDQETPSALHLAPHARPEQVMQREPVAAHAYHRVLSGTRSFSPAEIRSLQHTLGNQAVQRLLAATAPRQVEEAPLQRQADPTPTKENTTGLPDPLKAGIEHLSGLSMDDVNVHYNSPQPAEVQALAYTQGTEIHVASGQEQHLAHEAWHVVQQKQGRVKPTMQAKGVAINDDQELEREADVMGERANNVGNGSLQRKVISNIDLVRKQSSHISHKPIQRALGLSQKVLFVSRHPRHPVDANRAALRANSMGDAEVIYRLARQIPFDAQLNQLLVANNNNAVQALFHLNMVGVANLAGLLAFQSVVGAGDSPRVGAIINLAGGAHSLPVLTILLNPHPGNSIRLMPLLTLAASNFLAFDRLRLAVARFRALNHPAPAIPNTTAASIAQGVNLGPYHPPPPPAVGAPAVGGINYNHAALVHFLQRHTYRYFNFAGIQPQQGMWPAHFDTVDVVNTLNLTLAAPALVHPIVPGAAQVVPAGGYNVQIGVRGAAANPVIGQFFPVNGPGVETFNADEMRAIDRIR